MRNIVPALRNVFNLGNAVIAEGSWPNGLFLHRNGLAPALFSIDGEWIISRQVDLRLHRHRHSRIVRLMPMLARLVKRERSQRQSSTGLVYAFGIPNARTSVQ